MHSFGHSASQRATAIREGARLTFRIASISRGKVGDLRAVAVALLLLFVLVPSVQAGHALQLAPNAATTTVQLGAVDHSIKVSVTNPGGPEASLASLTFTLKEGATSPLRFRTGEATSTWQGSSAAVGADNLTVTFSAGGPSAGGAGGPFQGGQTHEFTLDVNVRPSASTGTFSIDVKGTHGVVPPVQNEPTQTSTFAITVQAPPPPKITSALTRDANGNGKIDALAVTFDTDMVVNTLNAAEFLVGGVPATGLDATANANGTARTATIRFAEGSAVNTGLKPDLTYPAGGAARSARGGALVVATNDVTERDDVAPFVVSAATRGDGAGKISGLDLVLSELVDASAAHVSDFTVTECTCGNKALEGVGASVSTLRITFTAEGTSGSTPSYRYAVDQGTRIVDPAGKVLADRADLRVALDRAPPIALSAVTQDADSDGKIDGYLVTMSEPVNDNTLHASEWAVAGRAVSGMSTGTASDPIFTVLFSEGSSGDSGDKPELTYTPGTGLRDLADNVLAAIGAGGLIETDGAKPVLGLSTVAAGDTTVSGAFSEPVRDETGAALVKEDFTYDNAATGGASAIGSVTHTAGQAGIVFTLNAALAESDFNADSIAATPAKVKDAAGNSALGSPVLLLPDKPFLKSAHGNIGNKTVVLTFSEEVDDGAGGALAVSDFAITAASGSAVASIAAVKHSLTSEPEKVELTLNQPLAATDVDGTPTSIGAAANSIFRKGSDVAASTQKKGVVDVTPPTIKFVETVDSNTDGRLDALKVTFSEPVADSTGTTSDLNKDHWVIDSTIGKPKSVVTGSTALTPNVANDNIIFLVFDEILDGSRTPKVSYVPGTLKDLATPPNSLAAASQIAAQDKVAPVTTLTLSPATPQGLDGWYTSAPTVTLARNEAGTTTYKLDSGSDKAYGAPFVLPANDDELKITYSSTDLAGNKEPDRVSPTLKIDSVKPPTPSQPNATLQSGRVLLAWSQVEDATSGVKEYLIKRNNQLLPNRVAAGTTTLLDTPPEFGTYDYQVAAIDHAGNIGLFSVRSPGIEFDPGKVVDDPTPSFTEQDIKDTNRKLRDSIVVKREGLSNVITWDLPSDLPADVLGLQLWRSTSPFERVRNIVAGSAAFVAEKYTDSGAAENATYLLTAYFSTQAAGGYSSTDAPGDIPGFDLLGDGVAVTPDQQQDDPVDGGVASWVWVALVLILLVVVALIAWLIIRLSKRPEDEFGVDDDQFAEEWADQPEETTWLEDEPPAWPGAEEDLTTAEVDEGSWEPGSDAGRTEPSAASGTSTGPPAGPHPAQCPNCQQHFQVTGQRPLIVTCPSCGTEGRLP